MKDNPGQTGSRRGRQALSAVTAGVMNQDSRPFHGLPAIRRWGKKPAEERRTSTSGSPIRTGIIHDVEIINYRTDPFAWQRLYWDADAFPLTGQGVED